MAVAAAHACFGEHHFFVGHFAAPHFFAEAPYITSADAFAAMPAGEHGSAAHNNGGQVHAACAHHQSRSCLVAAAEQHHAVEWVSADAFFHIHAHEITVKHGRRFYQC